MTLKPWPLPEGQIVEVTVVPTPAVRPSEEKITRRIRAASSLEEVFEFLDSLPEEQGEDELYEAMNANRHPSERVLFPPELKGKSW